jgi:hypothetical protein
MMQVIIVGLGAGVAAAVLFASLASGSAVAVILCLLAPLPLLITALGWSHWAGLIASLTGTFGTFALFGPFSALGFLTGVGLPGWWLGYLALLARPTSATDPQLEWYPVGKLVLWAALLSALIAAATLLTIQINIDRLRPALRPIFEQLMSVQAAAPAGNPDRDTPARIDVLVETFLTIAPLIAAVTSTISNLLNLWLAARIVKLSGRLHRPWPDIPAMTLPRHGFVLLIVAMAMTWLLFPDPIGILSGILMASLVVAFAALGFAVLHTITRGIDGRLLVLTGAYGAALAFWPMAMVMALLGLIDSAFNLRGRFARKRGLPPTSHKP